MATKQINAHVPEEEYLQLVEEFQQNGCSSLSDYLRQLITARREKTITLQSGDIDRVRALYDGKIEILKEQLTKAQADLAAMTEKGGLAGTEKKELSVATQIKNALEEDRAKRKAEDLQKAHDLLVIEQGELKKKCDDMQAIITSDARIAKAMEVGGNLLEGFARINPPAAQRLTNGIAGLFGGTEGMSIGEANLTQEQEAAFKTGQVLLNAFPDQEQKMAMIEIVEYFADNIAALATFITRNKHFMAWRTARAQQTQPV